jgi:hypothetical protein
MDTNNKARTRIERTAVPLNRLSRDDMVESGRGQSGWQQSAGRQARRKDGRQEQQQADGAVRGLSRQVGEGEAL